MHAFRKLRQQRAGFSFIEMIVVISIIGIIYGIAAPTMSRYNIRKKLEYEAEKIANVLEITRSASSTKHTAMIFTINAGAKEFYYIEKDGAFHLDKKHRLDSAVSFTGATPATITFRPTGRLESVSADQVITLQSGGQKQVTITVNYRTGRVITGELY